MTALFQNFKRYESLVNVVHLSCCWSTLGRLAAASEQDWFNDNASAAGLAALAAKTAAMLTENPTSGDIRARELANIAHGAAKSGRAAALGDFWTVLANAVEPRLGECNAQELANTCWAFAKAGVAHEGVFNAAARVLCTGASLDSFPPQELCNVAWAFSSVGRVDDKRLFAALCRAAGRSVESFTTQGLTTTLSSFAKAGVTDLPLLRALATQVHRKLAQCNAHDLAAAVWACAKLGVGDAALFGAAAAAAERHSDRFTPAGLANVVWGLAKSGHRASTVSCQSDCSNRLTPLTIAVDSQLFARAFEQPIHRHLAAFNAQDLSSCAWSMAKATHVSPPLCEALSRAARDCLETFNTQDVMNFAWAFVKLGVADAELLTSCAAALASQRLDELSAPQIANVAWTFATAGQMDTALFSSLARAAQTAAVDFTADDLASVSWAFANANQLDERLFKALASRAATLIDEFDEEVLDNVEWAFHKAGHRALVKQLRQRRKGRAGTEPGGQQLALPGASKCGRIVIAGGGIGGAAAAVALQHRGFDVQVLETDSSFDARKQGYGLTVQCADALQALGIDLAQDDAPSTSHYTFSADGHILAFFGEAFGGGKVRDTGANDTGSGRFVHLPRQALRHRLLEKIALNTVRWGTKLRSFEPTGNGGVSLTLTDGNTMEAALLVGCDGIFSTVRRQLALAGDALNYVGLVVVLGISDAVFPLCERRIFETVDGTTRIYVMPFTTTSTMWQLSFPATEEVARNLTKDVAVLKKDILRRCGDWHEPIPSLLRSTPLECMSGYPVYDRPVLEPETLRPLSRSDARVTLLGDAAHPMTPFKAQGANQALRDAVLLADTLAECVAQHGPQAGLVAALPVFERKMLRRSSRTVIASRDKAKQLHTRLALQPGRKGQRDAADLNVSEAIQTLQARGISASSATDPRGLDAVVAKCISGGVDEPAPEAQLEPCWGWAVRDDAEEAAWHKGTVLRIRKSGKMVVQWQDGSTAILAEDFVQPRAKKRKH